MKGLILAAGRGTRLRPLTDRRSKPMVTLANRPLIHYAIDKLVEIDVTEIGIVVGDNEAELRSGLAYPGAALHFIRQPEPKGLAHAVSYARDFTGDEDFVLLFCDNLFSETLHRSLDEWQSLRRGGALPPPAAVAGPSVSSAQNGGRQGGPPTECLIHVHQVPDPRACGVAVVSDGWVNELEEKPQQPKSNLAVVGIDFFTPRIYDAIGRIKPSFRGELEITDAISELIAMGYAVRAREIGGYWFDTGTFSDLLTAQARVMAAADYSSEAEAVKSRIRGKVSLPADCRVENSTLEEPVIVGRGSEVTGSRIGPNVAIGDNCYISECELSDCQVYSNTTLHDVHARSAIFEGPARIDVA